ncbi:MAG: ribonuclease E/G [Candidatus Binataceae bacterium]
MAGDTLVEIAHVRDGRLAAGTVLFGRVGPRVPHMPAVFVNVGRDQPGVLKVAQAPSEGTGVAVQIVVPERAGKGAELALVPDLTAPAGSALGAVLRPAPDPVLAWWTAAPELPIVTGSAAEATRLKTLLGPTAQVSVHGVGTDLFADVDGAVEAALSPVVALPGGGSIIIETTAAATIIDVNAGPADPDAANRAALAATAHALRLRNLAGHILVDTIPTARKAALPRLLTKLTRDDPTPVRVAGLTPLGMVELTRQRLDLSLAEQLCDADGRPSAETAALKALREAVRYGLKAHARSVTITCASDVAALIEGRLAPARAEAEDSLKCAVVLRADASAQRERTALSS